MNQPKTWGEVEKARLKVVSEVKDIDVKDSGTRIVFRASTPVRDRDQEEITVEGWRWNEGALPNQFYCHDTRTAANWIGKGSRVWTGDALYYETELFDKVASPLAETARFVAEIAREHPDALRSSVGFLPIEWKDPNGSTHTRENPGNSPPWSLPGRKYLAQELLENSVAPVPSNIQALAVEVRGLLGPDASEDEVLERIVAEVEKRMEARRLAAIEARNPWKTFFSPASPEGANSSRASKDGSPA